MSVYKVNICASEEVSDEIDIFSHASNMATGMAMPVCQSTLLVQTEIAQQLLVELKLCRDIHGPTRMDTNDLRDP